MILITGSSSQLHQGLLSLYAGGRFLLSTTKIRQKLGLINPQWLCTMRVLNAWYHETRKSLENTALVFKTVTFPLYGTAESVTERNATHLEENFISYPSFPIHINYPVTANFFSQLYLMIHQKLSHH